jgi:hypothetical protein
MRFLTQADLRQFPGPALSARSDSFAGGRRFEITRFRWLNRDEV